MKIQKSYRLCFLFLIILSLFTNTSLSGQDQNLQDSTLNNLVHQPDYQTSPIGELGTIKKFGQGNENLLLIAGFGFDWTLYEPLAQYLKHDYTLHLITVPGFGHTKAPEIPQNTSYAELTWTKAVVKGILKYIESNKISKPSVLSGFVTGTQIALDLALNYPEKIHSVILIAGVGKATLSQPGFESMTLSQRAKLVDQSLAPTWFKTVTKETWDSNMHRPEAYSLNPSIGMKARKQTLKVPLPVMIQYLCEYWTTDYTLSIEELQIPVLLLLPAYTPALIKGEDTKYLKTYFLDPWEGAESKSALIRTASIENSGALTWIDQPELTLKKLKSFMEEFESFTFQRKIKKEVSEPIIKEYLDLGEYVGKFGKGKLEYEKGTLVYVQAGGNSIDLVRIDGDQFRFNLPENALTQEGRSLPVLKFNRNKEGNIVSLSLLWKTGQVDGPYVKQ